MQFLSLECRVSFPVWGLAVLFGLCSDGLSPLKLRSRFLSTRPWRGLQTGRPFGPPLPRSAQTKNATNPPLRRGKREGAFTSGEWEWEWKSKNST